MYVDGSRWWSLTCDQACCPAEGTPYDVAGHRLAAEAVFAGLTTRASREELAATVAGPPPAEVPRLVELAAEVRKARAGRPTGEDPAARLVRGVQAGLADPGALDDRDCAELAVLVDEIRLRDLVWAMIDPESAEQHVGLWLRVVGRVAPDAVGRAAGPGRDGRLDQRRRSVAELCRARSCRAGIRATRWGTCWSRSARGPSRRDCGRAWVVRFTTTCGASSHGWPGEVT